MAYHHRHMQYSQHNAHQNHDMDHNQFINGSELMDDLDYENGGNNGKEILHPGRDRFSPEQQQQQHHHQSDADGVGLDDPDKSPAYLLEHLATFTVNKESGIEYPADGMRRLLQLEKTTGIWSQKMQLCLNNQWILIMDYETGNIIERFPATLILEPTAFTSTDAMELYNNILVFIVAGSGGAQSEMHIFQSQSVSAVHLVEDMKNLRHGKIIAHHHQHQQHLKPSDGADRAQDYEREQEMHPNSSSHQHQRIREYHTNSSQNTHTHHHHGLGGGESDSEHDMAVLVGGSGGGHASGHGGVSNAAAVNDDTSSTSSDKYERDVAVLNHCFDDIEKFIARLQHAAAASRELERRRRNRKSKTKRDPGEGLLYLRTRPPHEKEFIDIFAKFKLSFNLLAKLKAHIHDPNAPELVHFLFTPLALIVEASSDTYYDGQLPARVVAPLLTREATNLLINCVTSKETELWRSLGESWIVPRDQWKDDVPTYHPVFFDGWSPDYLVIDELENLISSKVAIGGSSEQIISRNATSGVAKRLQQMTRNATTAAAANAAAPDNIAYDEYDVGTTASNANAGAADGHISARDRHRERQDQHQNQQQNQNHHLDYSTTRSNISIESLIRNDHVNESGANPLVSVEKLSGGLQKLQTHDGRHSNNINNHHSENQVNHDRGDGLTAYHNIDSKNDNETLDAWLSDLQSVGAKIVLVTYQRTANNDKELSVVRGEYLEILDDTRKWWKARNIRGQIAHVPHTIVTPYSYPSSDNVVGSATHQHTLLQDEDLEQSHSQDRNCADTINWIRSKHLGKKGEFRYF